jgi:hypothetical protein
MDIYQGTTKKSMSASGVVYTGSSRLVKMIVTATGTGTFTVIDGDGTNVGDTVYNVSGATAGTVIALDCPMDYGINLTTNGSSQVTEFIFDKHKA